MRSWVTFRSSAYKRGGGKPAPQFRRRRRGREGQALRDGACSPHPSANSLAPTLYGIYCHGRCICVGDIYIWERERRCICQCVGDVYICEREREREKGRERRREAERGGERDGERERANIPNLVKPPTQHSPADQHEDKQVLDVVLFVY